MLQFINDNGVLFSGIFGLITALITAIFAFIIDKQKSKKDTINSLKKELEKVKSELNMYQSLEEQEKCIDKSTGSIYIETLPNGTKRSICGYCWESKHAKMPLIMDPYYSEVLKKTVIYGQCGSCKASCYEE